jgi:hypothetical protein
VLVFFGHFCLSFLFPPEFFSFPDDFAGMLAIKRPHVISYPQKSANR